MIYFDASFLVPLSLPEDNSELIQNFFQTLSKAELTMSEWTRLEVTSTLVQSVRVGKLKIAEAQELILRFEMMVNEDFDVLLPDIDDFNKTREWLASFNTKLKAPDALHLAIASNRGAVAIYSLDKRMISEGKKLGMPISNGPPLPGYGD